MKQSRAEQNETNVNECWEDVMQEQWVYAKVLKQGVNHDNSVRHSVQANATDSVTCVQTATDLERCSILLRRVI